MSVTVELNDKTVRVFPLGRGWKHIMVDSSTMYSPTHWIVLNKNANIIATFPRRLVKCIYYTADVDQAKSE